MTEIIDTCVIDDDPICVFGMKRAMKGLNFSKNISVYTNGLDAINGFKKILTEGKKLPSVVFLDLNMPIMDGWEFLEDFVKIPNHNREGVNIYIISSSVDPADILRAKEISAVTNYYIKPITSKGLNEILEELIDS
ncbi:response regulator [Cellulophaga sp. HaHaR_3_176]|uniref:response regulator n=1 Tax=Cellulophaga sp. HaHaR_3_176 TaxID=1942464 RepID=UPI001C1FA352|nr:response regulator [Cellulophaga sp. HaHaR_3_176]QWX83375.1 response regulator [Cellulophaga sp. HaHaR_3_176]